MVQSRLNKAIDYPEVAIVDEDDINHDSPLYQIDVYDTNIIIALGKVRFAFISEGVLYCPIYLVINDEISSQIGVYEFLNDNYINILDEDEDIDINKLDDPLFYLFFTDEFLEKKIPLSKDEDVVDEGEDDTDESTLESQEGDKGNDDESEDGTSTESEDDEDTESGDDDDTESEGEDEGLVETEEDEYQDGVHDNWVQSFFKNTHYHIIDNEGGGDCLFASIRDAFEATADERYSVSEQRALLATNVEEETFKNYKEFYNIHIDEIKQDRAEMKKMKKKMTDLRKLYLKHRTNRAKSTALVKEAKKLRENFKRLKNEKKAAQDVVDEEFEFMKGVEHLSDFKKIITTCRFWGDTWALSTLERLLNIKLILLSSANYNHGDLSNVLQCGQMNDAIIEKKGVFKPRYYIIIDYMGYHYKLVTYKGKKIFKFKELPYGLVKLISTTCMKGTGLYSMIPQLQQFKNKMEKSHEESAPLYDEDTVFQFYSKSKDVKPGRGSGEQIKEGEDDKYSELVKIPDWRKVMSNFFLAPFSLDDHRWNTVEHYYHANKFKKNHPDFYLEFTLDSKSAFSKDPVLAKAAGGKSGFYTSTKKDKKGNKKRKKVILRPKNIKADEEFWPKKDEIMESALKAKFTQNELAKQVLKATHNAKLVHYLGRGSGTQVWTHLMRIRKDI